VVFLKAEGVRKIPAVGNQRRKNPVIRIVTGMPDNVKTTNKSTTNKSKSISHIISWTLPGVYGRVDVILAAPAARL